MDPIDRQAIHDKVTARYPDSDATQYNIGYADAINDVLKDIRYMPSAESSQKTGKWIYRDPHSCSITCSVCGGYALSSGKLDPIWLTTEWNQVESAFCPNCGCRMIEQQESEDKE